MMTNNFFVKDKIALILVLCFALQPFMQYASAQVLAYPPYGNYGGDLDICTNADITDDFTSDKTQNYTRTTMVSYGGTNLITAIVNYTINPSQTISLRDYGYFGQYALSNSTLLSTDSPKKITSYGIYDRNFTLGLTNIGNKTVTILVPPYIPDSVVVVNTKTGTTVNGTDDYDFATIKAIRASNDQNIIMQYHDGMSDNFNRALIPIRLGPGDSLIRNGVHLESTAYEYGDVDGSREVVSTYMVDIKPGNYTLTAVSRFLAATDKGCTMVYLWSQPVDLTVASEDRSMAEKIPEFPLAVPVLLAGIISTIVFYRLKFGMN